MGTLFNVKVISPFGDGSSGSFDEWIELRLFWITTPVIIRINPTIPPLNNPIIELLFSIISVLLWVSESSVVDAVVIRSTVSEAVVDVVVIGSTVTNNLMLKRDGGDI